MDTNQRLPNFFLAGVPKSGTTSLHHYLHQHPQIFMSPIKEPHFFADEVRIENFAPEFRRRAEPMQAILREFLAGPMTTGCSAGPVVSWPDYVRLFRHATVEPAVGESSVCYLWSRTALRNIASRIPDAKILVMLRNPIERAFSQYLHMLSFADSPVSLRDHVLGSMNSRSTLFSEQYPFLEFGRYGEQLPRLLSAFPRERVKILFYEDYSRDAGGCLRDIFRFLQVADTFVPDIAARHMLAKVPRSYAAHRLVRRTGAWQALRGLLPAPLRGLLRSLMFHSRRRLVLTPADHALLAGYYRDDIAETSRLLGVDLSRWLASPGFKAGG